MDPVSAGRAGLRCATGCYRWSVEIMTEIASRELRNDTAGVLRRVEAGEPLTVTSDGRPVARLVPVPRTRGSGMSRGERGLVVVHVSRRPT
jgi:prevent-host-death family protein